MAKQNKAQKKLKTSERLTPYDAKTMGTMAEIMPKEKSPPRKLTANEVHGNNYAKVEMSCFLDKGV